MGIKVLFLIAGLLLIIFGGIAVADPYLVAGLAGLLFATGMLIYGILILVAGFMITEIAGWQRWLGVVLGFILIILGATFLFNWYLAFGTFLIFFAIRLLMAGFVPMIYGLSGSFY